MIQVIVIVVVYDFIGVGFGFFNIVLVIVFQEWVQVQGVLEVLFLDKQGDYCWYGNILVLQSELQIFFFKDLVFLCNFISLYFFVNYLYKYDCLVDFINLGIFYFCWMEFNDYLCWVVSYFQEQSCYGEEVLCIELMLSVGQVEVLWVILCNVDGEELVCIICVLVVSFGGILCILQVFCVFKGDGWVFYYSQYLEYMVKQFCSSGKLMKIVIIGGGQSVVEVFIDFNDSYLLVQVDMILCVLVFKLVDDSLFVNEVFVLKFIDFIYSCEYVECECLLCEYYNINYLVVDIDLIECIYGVFYCQKVFGILCYVFCCMIIVECVIVIVQGIELVLCDVGSGELSVEIYDVVILVIGYECQLYC